MLLNSFFQLPRITGNFLFFLLRFNRTIAVTIAAIARSFNFFIDDISGETENTGCDDKSCHYFSLPTIMSSIFMMA